MNLIRKMLDRDQESRIKASEVVNFKWTISTPVKTNQHGGGQHNKKSSPRKSLAHPPTLNIKTKAATTLKAGNNNNSKK